MWTVFCNFCRLILLSTATLWNRCYPHLKHKETEAHSNPDHKRSCDFLSVAMCATSCSFRSLGIAGGENFLRFSFQHQIKNGS